MSEEIECPVGKPGELVATGGRRLGVMASEWLNDWYVSHSPRNANNNAEGTWQEWVDLAKRILELEAQRATSSGGDVPG